MQPIVTDNTEVTKGQLKEWLAASDVPDDAELTLSYQDGRFVLWWRWSFSAGAFGDDMVEFSKTESDLILKDIQAYRKGRL